MYNNVYEDYIRSMIGRNSGNLQNDYLNCGNNIYDSNMLDNSIYKNYEFENNAINSQMPNNGYFVNSSELNLEECYPELYRLLYPMIQKVCMKCTRSLSKEVIDEMVDEVYINFAGDEGETTQININLSNDVRSSKDTSINNISNNKEAVVNNVRSSAISKNNSNYSKSISNKGNSVSSSNITVSRLDRSIDETREDRQFRQRNPILNDLIRILILRELLGRPGGNFRPPFGRPPQRPPHNRPNDNFMNFPNFPNRPNLGRPRENRMNLNQMQQSIYNSYPSDVFEDGYNIF